MLKDFNIELEAGGVNKPITKTFTAVVTDNTLDIRFYWAGKGTRSIPGMGVYGPLISAISVDPSKLFIILSSSVFSIYNARKFFDLFIEASRVWKHIYTSHVDFHSTT